MKSINIWKSRPNWSGAGSRGDLLKFKIDFVNKFVKDYEVSSILDLGCGDLHFASQLSVDKYTGVDIVDHVHPTSIAAKDFTTKVSRFDELDDVDGAELCMSIDVLYHILPDEVDYLHAALDNLFIKSTKYILVYAQDPENTTVRDNGNHICNSQWKSYLEEKDVTLIYEQETPMAGSGAKFFAYKVNE